MIHKGKDTVVRLPEERRYDPPHWSDLLRDAVKLREAWKLYAIAQREQVERLEKLIDFYKTGNVLNIECSAYIESETLELETDIENGNQTVEILRHAVVMAGDPE